MPGRLCIAAAREKQSSNQTHGHRPGKVEVNVRKILAPVFVFLEERLPTLV